MFVVHAIVDGQGNLTRDYGHVNQFFRCNPGFRSQKDERIFQKCVEQGFIYIRYWTDSQGIHQITYHKTLNELNDETVYNRNTNQTFEAEQ